MSARLVLIPSSKSVTLGNRVAVKGTVEVGIEELFCEGRAPFVLHATSDSTTIEIFLIIDIKHPNLLLFQKQKMSEIVT